MKWYNVGQVVRNVLEAAQFYCGEAVNRIRFVKNQDRLGRIENQMRRIGDEEVRGYVAGMRLGSCVVQDGRVRKLYRD